jgi:Fe-S cluster assembly ATP-binding protein
MHERLDTTIVIISHQERILDLADEIILMSAGTLRRRVTKDEIMGRGIVDGCECSVNCGKVGVSDAECVR